MELWKLCREAIQPRFGWPIELAEALGGDLARELELEHFGHLVFNLLDFALMGGQQGFLIRQMLVRCPQMLGNLGRIGKEPFDLLPEDVFKRR